MSVGGGRWAVGASHRDFAPSRIGPGRVSNRISLTAGAVEQVDFTLFEPGRLVTGMVSDALGGPIEGAWITIGHHPAISEPGSLIRTDAAGRFSLTVPRRMVHLSAYSAGYYPGSAFVPDIQGTAEVELVLTPETLVRGTVIWAVDARPVVDAEVFARGSGSSTHTDKDGRFELSIDPNRTNVVVVSAPGGHASVELPASPIGESHDVVIDLEVGADLELTTVIGPDRAPCGEGFVKFDKDMDVWGYLPIGDAPIEVFGLPVGTQTLLVQCRGTPQSKVQIQLREGWQQSEVVLERTPSVVGLVLASDGTAVPLANVLFRSDDKNLGADYTSVEGRFTLDFLPAGTYEIEARSDRLGEGALASVDTRDGDVEVVLRMVPWASVQGRLVDSNGAPVANVSLGLVEQPEPRIRGLATTELDGTFRFAAVRSGPLALFAGGLRMSWDGRAPNDRVQFTHDQDIVSELEIIIEARTRRIQVRVVDSAGEPVSGIRLALNRNHDMINGESLNVSLGSEITDLFGEVEFCAVPDGPLSIRWPNRRVESLVGDGDSFELVWQP